MTRPASDLTGRVFGKLTVLGEAAATETGASMWDVACACGRPSAPVRRCNLVSRNTVQCRQCRFEAMIAAAQRRRKPTAEPKADKIPENLKISGAVEPGLAVNTLVVSAWLKDRSAWALRCRFCEGITCHKATAILSGAAVCPTCRPSPRARLQAASAHP